MDGIAGSHSTEAKSEVEKRGRRLVIFEEQSVCRGGNSSTIISPGRLVRARREAGDKKTTGCAPDGANDTVRPDGRRKTFYNHRRTIGVSGEDDFSLSWQCSRPRRWRWTHRCVTRLPAAGPGTGLLLRDGGALPQDGRKEEKARRGPPRGPAKKESLKRKKKGKKRCKEVEGNNWLPMAVARVPGRCTTRRIMLRA